MNEIIYGGGKCTFKGEDNIIILKIIYNGALNIIDKTPPGYYIVANQEVINIFAYDGHDHSHRLGALFSYVGSFFIQYVSAMNVFMQKVPCRSKTLMSLHEGLSSVPEIMDIPPEDYNHGYTHGKLVKKTTVDKSVLEGQYSEGIFYTIEGDRYFGYYHIHWHQSLAMTGSKHTIESKPLFTKGKQTDVVDPT